MGLGAGVLRCAGVLTLSLFTLTPRKSKPTQYRSMTEVSMKDSVGSQVLEEES